MRHGQPLGRGPGFQSKVVIHGPDACFLRQTAKTDKAKVPYNWSTMNSNAFVYAILYNCGIKPVNLDHPGVGRVWLLIVLVSVFDFHVRFL
jgi:hypothetical protein